MNSLALVFPGQGSQFVGMGKELADAFPEARETFHEADDILGTRLSDLCFQGPAEVLTDTINAQPALLVTSMAVLRVIDGQGIPLPEPKFVAGHSMGEYTALVRAGSLSFSDGLKLVRERGRQMKLAGETNPGGMAAVIALDEEKLEEICRTASEETGRPVQIANYNCPGQLVISGDKSALEKAMQLAREAGAKRVIPLAVSIAAHSPLMLSAASGLAKAIEATEIGRAQIPVVANVSAQPITDPEEIQQELISQLTASVRWTESVRLMIDQGVDTFVEIGAGNVLSGLIRRIDRKVKTLSVGDPKGIEKLAELVGN